MATTQRMSRVDTAWLRMDSETNLMMIVGIWVLKPRMSIERVRELVSERLLKYGRFNQKVVEDAMGAVWTTDKKFDLEHHVCVEKLPKNTKATLQKRVGDLASVPLDPTRPLWQMHVVEDFNGQTVLISRIHHCIGDGISLTSVMLSITDGGRPPPVRAPKVSAPLAGATPQAIAGEWIKSQLIEPFTERTVKALGKSGDMAAGGLRMFGTAMHAIKQNPVAGLEAGLDAGLSKGAQPIRMLGQAMQDLAALGGMEEDSRTRLKGRPSGKKVVAWCEPMPLGDIKAVGKAMGCSINDVLLGCVAGAIGAYLKSKGDDVKGKEIRAMVPVNLRPLEHAYKLGNQFGLAPLVLPIGIDNPVQRVFEIHQRMNELKNSYQPLLSFSVLAVAGLLNKTSQDALLNSFGRKATAVMTNVPGPAVKLKFGGATVEQTLFWVPQSGDVGVGVSILSYGGGVQFGLITDKKLCPDPQNIIDQFKPEFDKLLNVVMLMPWK
jgi:diacylglycerol O-acyltransferase / wax synthase